MNRTLFSGSTSFPVPQELNSESYRTEERMSRKQSEQNVAILYIDVSACVFMTTCGWLHAGVSTKLLRWYAAQQACFSTFFNPHDRR